MNAPTKTDKMLSRKEGEASATDLQQSGAAQRRLAGHVGGRRRHPRRIRADKEIRVVVLTGAGGKAFVSGADISKFEKRALHPGRRSTATTSRSMRANNAFYEFPKPTIAMIRGYCIGGGVGLAMCCDMRICTEDSKFGVPAAKLGIGYRLHGHEETGRFGRARPSPRKSSTPRASSPPPKRR